MTTSDTRHGGASLVEIRAWPAGGVLLLLAFHILSAGCGPGSDGGTVASRQGQAFLLSDQPAGARGILEIKDELAASESPDQWTPVVLLARVGSVADSTWDPQRAAFTVLDLSAVKEVSDHKASDHDADQCPFCRAKERELLGSTAVVEIVDSDGQVPAVDARRFLGLEEGQDIVVRGRARVDSLGGLVVQAEGVYVRPGGTEAES